ncbi:hypothetical protein ATE84_0667 [Aquimarina sp. MAR_2010_214]|uniref:hypothetical protein n=1 Tax=Aquimarina sp. MAR_2010_214 TaxID=1250026 RepID=UPI000C70255D|nr:hypothetical protein [Aquimarina sp. MAR_2010_214]PKV48663.1 hypothetical protein ATE84_0667 [Aquimarina sp. MAR_2010_214]
MMQNNEQKKLILKKLDVGDLVATMTKVYQIKDVTDKDIILTESSYPAKPENYTEGLTLKEYPEDSFVGEQITVSKTIFVSGRISNSNMILSILNN